MDLLYLHNTWRAKGRFLLYGLKLTNQQSEETLVKSDDNLRLYQRVERLLAVFRGHNAGFVAGLALHRVRDGVPGILAKSNAILKVRLS